MKEWEDTQRFSLLQEDWHLTETKLITKKNVVMPCSTAAQQCNQSAIDCTRDATPSHFEAS